MATIYLLKYNNYYNRIVKPIFKDGLLTIDDYIDNGATVLSTLQNINFNPADGVTTELVVNYDNEINVNPDYLFVDSQVFTTSWFIIDAKRLRNGQFKMTLRRDVVTENFEALERSPMYMEKAPTPLVYNDEVTKENLDLNQIMKQDTELRDKTNCAWIVGWFHSNIKKQDFANCFKKDDVYTSVRYGTGEEDIINIYDISYYNFLNNKTYETLASPSNFVNILYYFTFGRQTEHKLKCNIRLDGLNNYVVDAGISTTSDSVTSLIYVDRNLTETQVRGYLEDRYVSATDYGMIGYFNHNNNTFMNNLLQFGIEGVSRETIAEYMQYQNKIIHDTRFDKYYRVKVTRTTNETKSKILDKNSGTFYWYFVQGRGIVDDVQAEYDSNGKFELTYETDSYHFEFVEVTHPVGVMIADASHIDPEESQMDDAPYCGFCIPCEILSDDTRVTYFGDNIVLKENVNHPESSISFGMALGAANLMSKALQGGQYLIDLQLVPYCPIDIITENTIDDTTTLDDLNFRENERIDFYGGDLSRYLISAYLFYKSSNTFDKLVLYSLVNDSKNIIKNILGDITELDVVQTKYRLLREKLNNNASICRLSASDNSSVFEFSPLAISHLDQIYSSGYTMGLYDEFYIKFTYKPFKSFIHINPEFYDKTLYGERENNRYTGLNITSDFSLPQVSDAWQTYQINNKNYANIFNRQIENMEVKNKWALAQSITNAAAGTIGGVAAGGLLGGGAGAVVGGIASAAGGIADVAQTIALQNETMDYTKDMYNYSLQNIQAQPSKMIGSSVFDVCNKVFPYLAVYTCTEAEFEALCNKVKYDGCTINRTDKIASWTRDVNDYFELPMVVNYFKGKLIRFEADNVDYHEVVAIAEEMDKGVFIE